jgi:hypothetical protein
VAAILLVDASLQPWLNRVLGPYTRRDRGLVWTDELRPLLLKRFPALTEEQVKEAHGYAYGGAVIQDLGYYPFGSVEFSDLVHYVRSGDFVRELLAQSQDANEYAFALGALAHYASDIAGHPAVNQAVSIQYPKLRAKYGNSVRYAEDHTAHLKTEFGFDMVQVAKNRYASAAVSRFHRVPGVEAAAGADFSHRLRSGIERHIGPRRSRDWFVPICCQPDDPENDTGCPADS